MMKISRADVIARWIIEWDFAFSKCRSLDRRQELRSAKGTDRIESATKRTAPEEIDDHQRG
jgi:hypothetical protein